MNIIRKLILYLNTLRYLRLYQVYHYVLFFIKRKCLNKYYISEISKLQSIPEPHIVELHKKPALPNLHILSSNTFNFLNKQVRFTSGIDWNDENQTKLWLYNLHYFDYLNSKGQTDSEKIYQINENIISEWIKSNPIGNGNGWEPYPLSLRIVNWIYFFLQNHQPIDRETKFKKAIIKSIYHQSTYLAKQIEFHISANHLFKNAKALYIAGLFFGNKKWLKKSLRILQNELKEQILPDGGHFELSPMYHAIVLEDVLDLINFNSVYYRNGYTIENEKLYEVAMKMLVWLHKMIQPDGDIPLFGDSAFNIALKFDHLKEYAEQNLKKKISLDDHTDVESLDSSGYYVFRTGDQYLIIDGGQLGLDYQPGHAHGDVFSYEYSYKGKRFIVDSGPGEYLDTELRYAARSIRGHNTFCINNQEPGQFWKAFRLGRRVKSPQVRLDTNGDDLLFQGNYKNKISRSQTYCHQREILFINNKFILIVDRVKSKNLTTIKSRIHPNVNCVPNVLAGEIHLAYENETCCILYDSNSCDIELVDWIYTPEFGKIIESKSIVLFPKHISSNPISYLITPAKYLIQAREYFNSQI